MELRIVLLVVLTLLVAGKESKVEIASTTVDKFKIIMNITEGSIQPEPWLVLSKADVGQLECNTNLINTWLKDGVQMDVERQSDNEVIPSIKIDGSAPENAGKYTCSTPEGELSVPVFIKGEEEGLTRLEEESKTGIEVERGATVRLAAKMHVTPSNLVEYTLMFYHLKTKSALDVANYVGVDITDRVVFNNETNILSYTMNNIQPLSHGKYEFTIKYGDLQETVDYFVTVIYAPQIISFEAIPEFVKKGESVAFTLNVTGYPDPVITWYHQRCCPQQQPVDITDLTRKDPKEFESYHLLNDGTLLNLINGREKFNGTFWADIRNDRDDVATDRYDYRLKGYAITIKPEKEIRSAKGPLIVFENKGSMVLSCVIDAERIGIDVNTTINISWYHDGNQLPVNQTARQVSDNNVVQVLTVDSPQLSDKGVYSCIAITPHKTLWSYEEEVDVVKQPQITVVPPVYKAGTGATVIFSCSIANIDGERGVDWDVRFRIKKQNENFYDISTTMPGNADGKLYLKNVREIKNVRCEPFPQNATTSLIAGKPKHPDPVYNDGLVEVVETPPVIVKIALNEARYTVGETLVMRCVVTTKSFDMFDGARIFWQHEDMLIDGPAKGYALLPDGRESERYIINDEEKSTKIEALILEDITTQSLGEYTCIYDGDVGRYEDTYTITVHPETPKSALSLIIGLSFVLIVLIIMIIVLTIVVIRSRQHSYHIGGATM